MPRWNRNLNYAVASKERGLKLAVAWNEHKAQNDGHTRKIDGPRIDLGGSNPVIPWLQQGIKGIGLPSEVRKANIEGSSGDDQRSVSHGPVDLPYHLRLNDDRSIDRKCGVQGAAPILVYRCIDGALVIAWDSYK